MNSFKSDFLEKQPISHSFLRTIRLLGEYRGKEALFMQQTPQVIPLQTATEGWRGC